MQRWLFRLYTSQSWYSIYRPRREARLSWPGWWLYPKMYILLTFYTTKIITFVIDVSTLRWKSSSGLTSGNGRQYARDYPICGSIGSSPCLDSCCPSSWSISPPLCVCQIFHRISQDNLPTKDSHLSQKKSLVSTQQSPHTPGTRGYHQSLISSWWSTHAQQWLSMSRSSAAAQSLMTTMLPRHWTCMCVSEKCS